MADDSLKQRQKTEAQVERWTTEAKKLAEAGNEGAALDLYRKAADELPGAPWLQHRTAELSRKLKKHDIAILYFRRAATAFQIADFTKRAVAPLRTAWTLALDGLPATSKLLVEVATELMQLHRRLGFAADATVTFERTNAALRSRGFSELAADVLERMTRENNASPLAPTVASSSELPPSPRPDRPSSVRPLSDVAPRGSGNPPSGDSASARSRALANLLARR